MNKREEAACLSFDPFSGDETDVRIMSDKAEGICGPGTPCEACRLSAERAYTTLEASGRAVVPREPTPAMKEAHRRAYHDLGEIATNQWSAMLAAALPPSKE